MYKFIVLNRFKAYDISIASNIVMVIERKNHTCNEMSTEKAKGSHPKALEKFKDNKTSSNKMIYYVNIVKLQVTPQRSVIRFT